jgi:hypothetical protein
MHSSNKASNTGGAAIKPLGLRLRIKLTILYPLVCMYLRLDNDPRTLDRRRRRKSHIWGTVVAACRRGKRALGPPREAMQVAAEAGRETARPLTMRAWGVRVRAVPAWALGTKMAVTLRGGAVAGPGAGWGGGLAVASGGSVLVPAPVTVLVPAVPAVPVLVPTPTPDPAPDPTPATASANLTLVSGTVTR